MLKYRPTPMIQIMAGTPQIKLLTTLLTDSIVDNMGGISYHLWINDYLRYEIVVLFIDYHICGHDAIAFRMKPLICLIDMLPAHRTEASIPGAGYLLRIPDRVKHFSNRSLDEQIRILISGCRTFVDDDQLISLKIIN